jgi:hypothetical protein
LAHALKRQKNLATLRLGVKKDKTRPLPALYPFRDHDNNFEKG